ncbi:GNAT family N-acetyltransferase [Alysiella crassa]|uniref:Phosphinothricin acetyltransferase YwnH n=1 Tax=Alysiella crassa TaxID=153491 RepID=A0A376BKA0_9NEIS|nr:GNAT family N-acetyltransferase [Alysiella crassa]UOP07660.1 N-acetyltransferase family protein [Alysiella crassa]SSY70106.1 Putative phosphinothricin acetyltransferase YwnH [Alysiella crassa]
MNTIITLATQSDLPEIVAIYNSTIASRRVTADLQPVSVASRQAWFDAHQKPNRPIYVMKNQADGQIIAWASFSDYYSRAAYDITAEISLYVHEQARGGGVGKRFLAEMLRRAPELGIRNVIGVIFAHNQASIALFQSFGFAQWGRLPEVCDLDGVLADIVLLGKQINE